MNTDTARSLEVLAVIQFAVLGLSHVVQPRAWAEFFTWLRERGDAGVFAYAFLTSGLARSSSRFTTSGREFLRC